MLDGQKVGRCKVKFLALGFLAIWGFSRGGFPFFFMFLMFLFVCMALKGGRHGWHHTCYGPDQQRPPVPEDVRPYHGQPQAPGNPYEGGYSHYGSEGTPTVRTGMNSGAGTVRVDNAPNTGGQPTAPLGEQPRARVADDQ